VTCWAEVDLSAIRHNLRLARSLAPGAPAMAIVKADAYGHGAVPVSRALVDEGVDSLAVATVGEGRELRVAGLAAPVLVLGRIDPAEYPEALRWGLEVAVPEPALGRALSAVAVRLGVTARAHLKVDTGMCRLGVPWEQGAQAARDLASLPGLFLAGVFSHFASADAGDPAFTALQVERFSSVMAGAAALGVRAPFHLPNSAGILGGIPGGGALKGAGIRPGLMLYGAPPSPALAPDGLRPALSWKCRVIQVRDAPEGTPVSYSRTFTTRRPTRLAVIAIGYADGFPRSLSNRARLLVRGRRAPVAGRVCMDLTVLDVTGIEGVGPGDEVVVIGEQGGARITATELADLAGTISYDLFCGISRRVPRLYPGADGPGSGGGA
jgi:alanine racemase